MTTRYLTTKKVVEIFLNKQKTDIVNALRQAQNRSDSESPAKKGDRNKSESILETSFEESTSDSYIEEQNRTQTTYIVPTKPFSSNSISVIQSSLLQVIPPHSHSLKSLRKRRAPSKGNCDPHGSDPAAEHCSQNSPLVAK